MAIKELDCGIIMKNFQLNILLYVGGIALITDSSKSVQHIVDTLSKWCSKYRFNINTDKTKVVHLRMPSIAKTDYNFRK